MLVQLGDGFVEVSLSGIVRGVQLTAAAYDRLGLGMDNVARHRLRLFRTVDGARGDAILPLDSGDRLPLPGSSVEAVVQPFEAGAFAAQAASFGLRELLQPLLEAQQRDAAEAAEAAEAAAAQRELLQRTLLEAQRRDAAEAAAAQRELLQRMLRPPESSPATPAQRAHTVLEVLSRIDRGIVVAVPGAGVPVLTPSMQAELDAVSTREGEAAVVAFMTPILARLRGCTSEDTVDNACAPVLVNSERLPWLVYPAAVHRVDLRMKPDLFRSWRPFVELRGGGQGQGRGEGFLFGVLGGYALQRAACVSEVYEAKRDALTDAAFGELCAYQACTSGSCRGVLFGSRDFWLYETFEGSPIRLVKARWADSGSEEVFCGFFAAASDPPLVRLLRALLLRAGAAVTGERAYLGSGASGHVFAVRTPASAEPRALKLVLAASPESVVDQYHRMCEAAAAGAPVLAPLAGSLVMFDGGGEAAARGGGFLLRVGAPAGMGSLRACTAAFAALASLHAAGVRHGDARLPNLLDVGGGVLRWIDLRGGLLSVDVRASPVFSTLQRNDAYTLARSALGSEALDEPLPAPVADAVRSYVAADSATVEALATAVWEGAASSRG